jgi:hypothetical protein
MMRLVQIQKGVTRRVAIVEEPRLQLLAEVNSIYALAQTAIADTTSVVAKAQGYATSETLDYDQVYRGEAEWKLLPPIDHPDEPARLLISGTGLTHLGSARDRQNMHISGSEPLTDSMKIFRLGLERGRPAPGSIGVAPEWFYKGTGTALRAHGQPLLVPSFSSDGGEEAEIAGVYVIGPDGIPRRLGMAAGNEFSDHAFEKTNYLNLAGSKLRTCALGPELVVEPQFQSVIGQVTIERGSKTVWQRALRTGETEMCHSLQNIEHHHFKFDAHRRPGDVHVHYFGTDGLSFGDGVKLADGDIMVIGFEGFGRPLRNPIQVVKGADLLITTKPL